MGKNADKEGDDNDNNSGSSSSKNYNSCSSDSDSDSNSGRQRSSPHFGFACSISAIAPPATAALEEVPEKASVHPPPASAVTM